MFELFLSAIGGASIALAIAAYLSKSFIKIQTDKMLARHTHALAIEKERLGHELAVELHQKNLRISRYEQDKIEALKSLYEAVINLYNSLSELRKYANLDKNQDFAASYFTGLKNMFLELAKAFTDISQTYRSLELNSVYIDIETEHQLKAMIDSIHIYYIKALARCDQILLEAQNLGRELNHETQPIDLVTLWNEMAYNWQNLIDPSAKLLKEAIRSKLQV